LTKGKFPVIIKEALIDNTQDWCRKHLNSIHLNYHKAEYFDRYSGFFDGLYKKEWENLSELNEAIINYLIEQLNISTKIVKASQLNVEGEGSDLLINICRHLGAGEYIYGKHGEDYMDLDKFKENGIVPVSQNFQHPVYRQQYRPFVENMSAIDLLFNEGESSLKILTNNG